MTAKHMLLLGLFLFSVVSQAHDSTGLIVKEKAHNEASSAPGIARPAYQEFSKTTGIQPYPVSEEAVSKLLGMPLGDAIKILPIPLVLSDKEYKQLQTGAQRRAEALMAFFADIVFNDAAKAIESGILSASQIEMILRTENVMYNPALLRKVWKGRTIKDVNIFFGPDVIRNPHGEFRVLEDNIGGLMGGIGDIAEIHNAYFSSFGGADPGLRAPFIQAIEQFLNGIPREEWSEKAVFIYREFDAKDDVKATDEEDRRIGEIAKSLGIKVIAPSSLKGDSTELTNLLDGKYKKVINLYSIFELDDHQATVKLLNAFSDKKFDLMVGPGIDAMGSKAMLPFVDRLTKIYLNKPSLLKSQPTEWLLDETDLDKFGAGWVVKKVDGRQGKEVYLLDSMTKNGKKNLINHMADWNSYLKLRHNESLPMFIRQEMVDPSYIPAELNNTWVKFNVDYRPHVFILGGKAMTPAIWGRASWKVPGVLNNVSQTAMELVVTSASLCERALMSR